MHAIKAEASLKTAWSYLAEQQDISQKEKYETTELSKIKDGKYSTLVQQMKSKVKHHAFLVYEQWARL